MDLVAQLTVTLVLRVHDKVHELALISVGLSQLCASKLWSGESLFVGQSDVCAWVDWYYDPHGVLALNQYKI